MALGSIGSGCCGGTVCSAVVCKTPLSSTVNSSSGVSLSHHPIFSIDLNASTTALTIPWRAEPPNFCTAMMRMPMTSPMQWLSKRTKLDSVWSLCIRAKMAAADSAASMQVLLNCSYNTRFAGIMVLDE